MLTYTKKELLKTYNSIMFTVIKNILVMNNIRFEEIIHKESYDFNRYSNEYIINVRKKDYDKASHLIMSTLA